MKYYNGSVRNLVYRLRKFKAILDEELRNEILRHEDVIVKMVAEDQLYDKGIEGRGIKISDYMPYAEITKKRKLKKGQPINRVTLRDTGEFHDSLRVEFDDEGFYVTSDDDKAKYLLDRYGKTIFRLSNENLNTLLREYVRPSLADKLKNYIEGN